MLTTTVKFTLSPIPIIILWSVNQVPIYESSVILSFVEKIESIVQMIYSYKSE